MVARVGKPGLPAVMITAWQSLRDLSSWRGMLLIAPRASTMPHIMIHFSASSDDSPCEKSEYSVGCGKR
jgi:hypothetical protein